MTWTKLSDDFTDDCWQLSDAAKLLHIDGLVWSNRKLLDCRISKQGMERWTKHPEAAAELVDTGWWADAGEYYRIRHHAVYQRDAESVLAQQERNRENGAKGGRRKGPPREQAPRKRTQMGSWESENPDGLANRLATGLATGLANRFPENVQNPTSKPNWVSDSLSELPSEMDGPGEENCSYAKKIGDESFTPTPEQLRRINENVMRGYES
jgi:hypothetical protein